MKWVEMSRKSRHLDDEIKVTAVIVVGNGGVAPGDDLAVNLCGNGDVLADREAQNVLNVGERETVAGEGIRKSYDFFFFYANTYMAVLGETLVTFSRGNSFHLLGSRGLVLPIKREVDEQRREMRHGRGTDRNGEPWPGKRWPR